MHINAHLVETAAHTPAVNMHIDNMPKGGTPGENSITTAMLKDGQVTDAKLAQNAVGTGNIKDGQVTKEKLAADALPKAATKEALGTVKQAAHVANVSSGDGAALQKGINDILKALTDAGIMASA